MSAFCWLLVFRPGLRRKVSQPIWRVTKEGRETIDAVAMATNLILAMVFSLVTIVFIVVAVYRYFAQ